MQVRSARTLALALSLGEHAAVGAQTAPLSAPILIRNDRILDGTGRPRSSSSVFVRGNKIERIVATPVRRSTLADANETRGWRIYADFAQRLIEQARRLYTHEDSALELANVVYALDSTTIDLRLPVLPWACFRTT